MDDNLSFLRQQPSPHSMATVGKKKVDHRAEVTLSQQVAAAETSKQLSRDEQLLASHAQKRRSSSPLRQD